MTTIDISLDETVPVLTVNGQKYYNVNILSKLYQLSISGFDTNGLYEKASMFFAHSGVPSIGCNLALPNAIIPKRSIEDVGYDLTIVKVDKVLSKNTIRYDTGVSLRLPLGFYAQVHLRSSMSKHGYILSNGTGIIDPGYTGSILICLTKIDSELPDIELPCRCAQFVITPYVNTSIRFTDSNLITLRGNGGFGSTG